jgi:cob(I)alamin adenosyltransferase
MLGMGVPRRDPLFHPGLKGLLMPPPEKRHGLIIVYTGNGKGKTSAALGIVLRMMGLRMRACMLQFIKKRKLKAAENRFGEAMGVEIVGLGDGFTWMSRDLEHDKALALEGWELCKQRIRSGDYDVVILDEITYPITFGWLDVYDVLEELRNRPEGLHIVITGRDAHPKLIEAADLVTEMVEIKHPYAKGVPPQKGIDC